MKKKATRIKRRTTSARSTPRSETGHLLSDFEEKLNTVKKLEMLEDLNRTRTEFVSAVSHELRTPLAVINQLLLLIYDETAGPLNDKQREILVKVRHNIDRQTNIINKMLDISRLERKELMLR